MEVHHEPKLTSAELAMLWSIYMNDTMATCFIEHFLETVEDKDVPTVLNQAKMYAEEHLTKVKELMDKEKLPIPKGFSKAENLKQGSTRLFSDVLYLRYLRHMGRSGMATYSLATGTAVREDVLVCFKRWLTQSAELYEETTKLMVSKGIMVRSPTMAYPTKVEFVEKQHFLAGFFGERRPLLAMELAHIGVNIEVNSNIQTLLLGFAQIAQSKKVQQYLMRGHEIASKHKEIFESILETNNSPTPGTWDGTLSTNTTPIFSDKLLMFQVAALTALSFGDYGAAFGASLRRDLGLHYSRLMMEVAQFAEDGVNIMIDHGWLEKPPQTIDRRELLK